MNILKHSVFAIGLVVVLAAGCTPMSTPEGSDREIVFAQRGILTVTNATKVSEVTSLSSFNVSAVTVSGDDDVAVWTNQPFSLVPASDPATYAGGKFWPSANPSYRFYASNAELAFGASGTTVSVTTDTDIVCAYMTDATYGTKNTLSFGHVFARLGVVTVSTDDKYDVSDITVSLVNIKTGGTYNLRTGAGNVDGTGWSGLSPSGTSATQVYRYAGTILPNGSQAGADNDLWLVPGQYVLKATWTAHVNDYTQTFTDMEAEPVTIVAGKKSAVSCTLIGDEVRVTVTPVDVIGWSTGTSTERTGWNSGADPENPNWGTGGNSEGIGWLGVFSVSSNKKVVFSPGNLQCVVASGPTNDYNYAAATWKFADHQWEMCGQAMAPGNTIDLFSWVGTTASWNTYGLYGGDSANNAYVGTSAADALKIDWGTVPGIGNGWQTPTQVEWEYLFNGRENAASKYGTAVVNGVNGMCLLPDNFVYPENCSFVSGMHAYAVNTYVSQAGSNNWDLMESQGVVFLPANNCRWMTNAPSSTHDGFYWSSTATSETNAGCICFGAFEESSWLQNPTDRGRYYGYGVRLIKQVR